MEAADENGRTALHITAAKGHAKLVSLLLARGARTDIVDKDGDTPLHDAARNGNIEVIIQLLDKGANMDAVNKNGRTALHFTVAKGHAELVCLLLARGARTDIVDKEGDTPLHDATQNGHIDVINHLLDKGASMEAVNKNGHSALHLAAIKGHSESVSILLAKGAQTDTVDKEGDTLLHDAARHGHLEVTKQLLDKGAHREAVNKNGRTALHLATIKGYLEVVNCLLVGGAQIEAADENGRTALHVATIKGYLEVVNCLLVRGAQMEAADENGRTALHITAAKGHAKLVSLLLARGARTDAVDKDGDSPLHDAARNGHLDVINRLLDKLADVKAINTEGDTPMHKAARNGHSEVISRLLDKGAQTEALNKNGKKPIDLASNEKVRVLLLTHREIVTQGGSRVIKRCQVLVVGHGASGKTTLIHRLEKGFFDLSGPAMTDGIMMKSFKIEDVEFSFFDFAGQVEYDHTHSLFFRSEALFLVLHNPRTDSLDRLEDFFAMIRDKAPEAQLIFVTTRASEATLGEDTVSELRQQNQNIVDIIAVDSKTNIGIDDLKKTIVKAALNKSKLPRTITEVPVNYAEFLDYIQKKFLVADNSFSLLPYETFADVATFRFSIDNKSVVNVKELFCFWGMLFELSTGDLVLKPQQLADVLACVFTKIPGKIERMGDIAKGILLHQDSVVEVIWGEKNMYPKHLWSFDSVKSNISTPESSPPFLNLLHRAELGYPLYGPTGLPLGATFIPALLPERPIGFTAQYPDGLMDFFIKREFGGAIYYNIHPSVVLSFNNRQPQRVFVSQLIVRLRHYSMIDGVWKHGAGIMSDDASGKKSRCIFYVESNKIVVLSCGFDDKSTGARAIFFNELLKLVVEKYPSLRANGIQLGHNIFDTPAKIENMVLQCDSGNWASLRGLSVLFDINNKALYPSSSEDTFNEANLFKVERMSESLQKLSDRVAMLKNTRKNNDELSNEDFIDLNYLLLKCILDIIILQRLPRVGRNCIHTLWVVYRSTDSNKTSVFAIAPGAKAILPWKFVKGSEIVHPVDTISIDGSEISQASEVLKDTLHLIKLVVPDVWKFEGLTNLQECTSDIMYKERDLFAQMDDASSTDSFVLKEDKLLALATSSFGDLTNLKESQINGFKDVGSKIESVQHQVQEVRNDMSHHFDIMKSTMENVALRMRGETKELQKVWKDQLTKLESALSHGSKKMIRLAINQLRLQTKTAIDSKTKTICSQFHFIEGQLMNLLQSQSYDKENYEIKWKKLLEGLRSVQEQLTRVEVKIDFVDIQFVAVNNGVIQIRNSLQNNSLELQELRRSWDDDVTRFEIAMNNNQDSTKLVNAIEYLKSNNDIFTEHIHGSLRDAMNAQFDDMMKQLLESSNNKEEQQLILTELRAVQAQLAEVLKLSNETRARLDKGLDMLRRTVVNINERTCPSLFIMLPRNFNSADEAATAVDTAVNRLQELYSFISDLSAEQTVLMDLLHEKEYLALVCELCHMPQFPAIELTKPRETIGKILPLAKVGLTAVCTLKMY